MRQPPADRFLADGCNIPGFAALLCEKKICEMKKIFLLSLAVLLGSMLYAQPTRPGSVPPPTRYSVSFESQHGETFSVFIDGDLQNRMPQSRVMVTDIGDQTHEVVVVLKRPAEKAAVLMLRPGEPNVTVNVSYDSRSELFHLYTPAYNRPDGDREAHRRRERPEVHPAGYEPYTPAEQSARQATDDDVDMMVLQLKEQPFDNERLALAKTLVSSAMFTSAQIARMGQTIDFSNSQVDFLKYAYSYCSDPQGYARAMEILTFNADRRKVADYIATQR